MTTLSYQQCYYSIRHLSSNGLAPKLYGFGLDSLSALISLPSNLKYQNRVRSQRVGLVHLVQAKNGLLLLADFSSIPLGLERKYALPILPHIRNRPVFRLGFVPGFVELSDGGCAGGEPLARGGEKV